MPEFFIFFSFVFLVFSLIRIISYINYVNFIKLNLYVYLLNLMCLLKYYKIEWQTFTYEITDVFILDYVTLIMKILLYMMNVIFMFMFMFFYKYEYINKIGFIQIYIGLTITFMLFLNSNDMIFMFFILEILSICLYILMGFQKYSNFSTEGCLKYFVMGGLSSCFVLLGLLLFYGIIGSSKMGEINMLSYGWGLMMNYDLIYNYVAALIFLVLGFTFKLGLFPFLMWVPDVYQSASKIMLLILATVTKMVVLTFFYKIYLTILYNLSSGNLIILGFVVLSSMLIGTIAAFYQTNVKRMWGYSAVVHVSLIAINLLFFNLYTLFVFYTYTIAYIIITMNFIFSFFLLRSWKSSKKVNNIKDLILVSKSYSFIGLSLGVVLFSLIGIPPLMGFFAKSLVILNMLNNSEYFTLVSMLFLTFLGTFYYLRLIRRFYFKITKKTLLIILWNIRENIIIIILMLINMIWIMYADNYIEALNNIIEKIIYKS